MPVHELKYSIKVKSDEEDDDWAVEYLNTTFRILFQKDDRIVDWDGPL